MQILLSLLPLLLSLALMVSMAKLSARLYRRSTLSWTRALVYVVLLLTCTIVMGLISRVGGTKTPLLLAIPATLSVHLLLGGWYFGRYAHTSDGKQLGFPHGALLSLVFVVTTVAIFAIPGLILLAVRP